MIISNRTLPSASSFRDRIAHVVEMCSKEKMFRVYARRIVTGMAHFQPVIYRSVMKLPGNTVGIYGFLTKSHPAVSDGVTQAGPFPAFVISSWNNPPPKPKVCWLLKTLSAAKLRILRNPFLEFFPAGWTNDRDLPRLSLHRDTFRFNPVANRPGVFSSAAFSIV
jgi:hypothetical protein